MSGFLSNCCDVCSARTMEFSLSPSFACVCVYISERDLPARAFVLCVIATMCTFAAATHSHHFFARGMQNAVLKNDSVCYAQAAGSRVERAACQLVARSQEANSALHRCCCCWCVLIYNCECNRCDVDDTSAAHKSETCRLEGRARTTIGSALDDAREQRRRWRARATRKTFILIIRAPACLIDLRASGRRASARPSTRLSSVARKKSAAPDRARTN